MVVVVERGWGVGSISFDVQGGGWGGVSPNSDPFGQTEKGGEGVQKLDIFHGCHKYMVPYLKLRQEKNEKGGNGERDPVIRRDRMSCKIYFSKYRKINT